MAPFALQGQLPQLFSRLFPFTRGLNHAYWAPNAWALVTAFDRVLLFVAKVTNRMTDVKSEGMSSTSRGLVGDTVFAVLPNIKPIHTFAITIACQTVCSKAIVFSRACNQSTFSYSWYDCGGWEHTKLL